MSDPFSDELRGNPVWETFLQQVQYNGRVNLTDLWRASGRKRGYSPRQYARNRSHMLEGAEFIGNRADDPVFVEDNCAYHYMQLLDDKILLFMGRVFMHQIRKDPVGHLLSPSEHSEGPSSILGMLVSTLNADIRGRKIINVITVVRGLKSASRRTQGVGSPAKESAPALDRARLLAGWDCGCVCQIER